MNDYGDDKEGYSNNLDAQIAFLSDAFKRSSSKQERRALFNQAFGLARKAGMQQFDWATGPIAVKLAEHAQVATHVANAEHERAEKLQVTLDKSQAKVTNIPKMVYDQLYSTMPTARPFTTAPALNTLPVPEDVMERNAIGEAGLGYTQGSANASALLGIPIGIGEAMMSKMSSLGRLAQGNLNFATRGQNNLMQNVVSSLRSTSMNEARQLAEKETSQKLMNWLYRYAE